MSDSESPDVASSAEKPSEASPTRRNMLLDVITAVISFLLIAVPSTLAGIFYLDPILRRKKASSGSEGDSLDGFIKLDVTRDVIPDDGRPVAVTVMATLDDAWNRFRDVPVGSIWLRKQADGQIIAFNSICPHLGCSVNYRRSEGDFFCPCHTSSFDLDGNKTNEIPPRDMDSLSLVTASEAKPDPEGQELWLKFQNFRGAIDQKIPV
ncbi:MAG: Rieske 2Fe-2S domain-containing protein [Fuerstiella sp.]